MESHTLAFPKQKNGKIKCSLTMQIKTGVIYIFFFDSSYVVPKYVKSININYATFFR